jgi:hypothetical protein
MYIFKSSFYIYLATHTGRPNNRGLNFFFFKKNSLLAIQKLLKNTSFFNFGEISPVKKKKAVL